MTQVKVKYNPYRLVTEIEVNGRTVQEDSDLYKLTKGKRLQEWIGEFPDKLREATNSMSFSLTFYGMDLDWDDFEEAFQQAANKKSIKIESMNYIAPEKDGDMIQDEVKRVFTELQEGPVEAFKDRRLQDAFDAVNNSVFPVNVIATMSSGKSTLINALLGNKLMPSKNEACTATITEILDSDKDNGFSAIAYDGDGNIIKEIPVLTYEEMDVLNADEQITRVEAQGDIPFLDSRSMALKLVDTPGPNNAQNQEHRNTTYRAINNNSNNLILYVLNATQLSTNDDAQLLKYVSDQIRTGGKQMRDRFLFVVNKMDQFNPEEESIEKAIQSARHYLAQYGIQDPQLFPCSAFVALNIHTYFDNVDIDNLGRAEERKLPIAARDTLPMIDKLVEYESMHLEQYSTLSPSAQQELDVRLQKAVERGDTKEQALIHSGICSIEAAIAAYVKKYAKTKKVKDLVETFNEVLESSKVLANAKALVASNKQAAEACVQRAAAVRQKIADGKEAAAFKQEIAKLDPMPEIKKKADNLALKVENESSEIFECYPETITRREEAVLLINQFVKRSGNAMAEMTAELESTIGEEVVQAGNDLIQEYMARLTRFDETADSEGLDFSTFDLIKGELSKMQETVRALGATEAVNSTVDDLGEVTYEKKTYYEKVGEEEEEILVGTHKEKVGTRQVKTGSHREKVGERRVRNPEKRWWKFFTPKYVYEDVYKTIDDYTEEDVYEEVKDYETRIKDIMEKREETIEKFSVLTDEMQTSLMAKLHLSLDGGIQGALDYAADQVGSLKEQFSDRFDELDKAIQEKYAELEKCADDQERSQQELEENQRILDWMVACANEINDILEI